MTTRKTRPGTNSALRIGFFDIETCDLYANAGRILCACVLESGTKNIATFRADSYVDWVRGLRYDDEELVSDILYHLRDFDVLVAYNGVRFDYPWMQSKALKYGLDPLSPSIKIIDPLRLARRHMRLTSNRLDTVARYLDCKSQKTPLDIETWIRAVLDGDTNAMDLIVKHCQNDVKVLAEVMSKLRKFVTKVDTAGSWK